jgi:outer membrane protein
MSGGFQPKRATWVMIGAVGLMSLHGSGATWGHVPQAPGAGPALRAPALPSAGGPAPPPGMSPAHAPPAGALTLDQAVGEALRARPLLSGDTERVGAARARVTQARAGLLPRIDLQGSATDGPLGSPPLGLGGLVGTPLKKHTGGSLNFVQTLLDFGRTHNLVQARRAETSASEEALRADTDRVALDVQQAFLQVLQAQRLLQVNQQIVAQRQLVARQAETLRQNGLTSRVDVDLAEFNVSQAQLAVARAQDDIEVAFAALGSAIGRPVPSTTTLQDVVPAPPPTGAAPSLTSPVPDGPAPPAGPAPSATPAPSAVPSLEDSLGSALRDRPELRQVADQVRAAERLEAAARAGKLPVLTGVGSVGKVNPVPLFAKTDKPYAVGVALTIPIFTGGLVEGQVQEARRNAAALRDNLSELTNQIRQQVTSAVSNLSTAEETIQVAQAQLVRAQDALSLATQRYQSQLGSIVELTQAQVSYATAQNDFIRALYDREVARAALDFATGRGYRGPALQEQGTTGNQRGGRK